MRPWVGCGRRSLHLVFLCPVPPGAHREAPTHSVTAHLGVSKSHLSNWAKTRTHACTHTHSCTHTSSVEVVTISARMSGKTCPRDDKKLREIHLTKLSSISSFF